MLWAASFSIFLQTFELNATVKAWFLQDSVSEIIQWRQGQANRRRFSRLIALQFHEIF
jgi:hypothetical protein